MQTLICVFAVCWFFKRVFDVFEFLLTLNYIKKSRSKKFFKEIKNKELLKESESLKI